MVLGNGGLVLASDDDGVSFQPLNGSSKASLAQGVQLTDGQTLAVGDQGIKSLTSLVSLQESVKL
ncbi:hypothetical protein D3C76_1663800 [compost metagenome]